MAKQRYVPLRPLAVWFVVVAVWLTWSPFGLALEMNAVRLLPRTSLTDIFGNLALLMPIGVVLAVSGRPRAVRDAALAGLGVSGCLEVGQLFLDGRVVSVGDLLLNATGAVLAAAVVLLLARWIPGGWILGFTSAAVLCGALTLSAYSASRFGTGLQLANWDPEFEILLGDEVGAGRRYQGTVSEGVICGGPEAAVCAGPGADLPTRRKLVEAAETSQRLEIHATLLSTSDQQTGPARIITFSDGPYERNVTLAQEGRDLLIRLRTPLNGPNGSNYEFWIPRAIRVGEPTRITAAFEEGSVDVEIRADGARRSQTLTLDGFSGGMLLGGQYDITPGALLTARLVGASVLLLPLLLIAIGLIRWVSRRRSWWA
jgi:glycopeptide antibiotics resistance protein